MLNSLDAIGSVTPDRHQWIVVSRDSAGARSWPYFFVSPCVLPLVPGYLSYIWTTGAEIASEDGHLDARGRSLFIVIGCTLFVAGFSVVFIALGATFGAVSGWLLEYQTTIQRVPRTSRHRGLDVRGLDPLACNGSGVSIARPRTACGSTPLGFLFDWVDAVSARRCRGPELGSQRRRCDSGWILELGLLCWFRESCSSSSLGLAFGRAAGALKWVRSHYLLIMRIGGMLVPGDSCW